MLDWKKLADEVVVDMCMIAEELSKETRDQSIKHPNLQVRAFVGRVINHDMLLKCSDI